jgi:hypothetical protein
MTATERFKKYVSDLLERMFVLEEELEKAHARIAELEAEKTDADRRAE